MIYLLVAKEDEKSKRKLFRMWKFSSAHMLSAMSINIHSISFAKTNDQYKLKLNKRCRENSKNEAQQQQQQKSTSKECMLCLTKQNKRERKMRTTI